MQVNKIEVVTAFGFCVGNVGGNKAGICLLKPSIELSHTQKLEIAREMGYSETAFIYPKENYVFYIEYFTPVAEVDLCGHATIAAYSWLKGHFSLKNGIYKLETKHYQLEIEIEDNMIMMAQPRAIVYNEVPFEKVYQSLGLKSDDGDRYTPTIVSTGIEDLMIGVNTVDALKAIQMDRELVIDVCKSNMAQGYHVYVATEVPNVFLVRNFAPLLGIDEESATGTSNCALSHLLRQRGNLSDKFLFKQGMFMNEPSEILTKYDELGDRFWVGGFGRIALNESREFLMEL